MSGTHNPILDSDWKLIWAHNDGEAEKAVMKAVAGSKVKFLIMAAIFMAVFIWAKHYMFIYAWVGYGIGYLMIFWYLFLNPIEHLPARMGLSKAAYVQDIVFENPKSPSEFIKHHWEHQKYEWLAFLFFWCIGVSICIYWDHYWWIQMVPYQGELINKMPSIIPIAVMLGLIMCSIFGILTSQARPTTGSGKTKKAFFMGALAFFMIASFWVSFQNAAVMNDVYRNWEAYSTRYPRELSDTYGAWPWDEVFFNWNLFFWSLGLVLSAIIGMFFALCCNAYINLNIRKAIKGIYRKVLETKVEGLWEYQSLAKRHDHEEKLKLRIRIISGVELAFFFTMVLVALWGFYYFWGEAVGNNTMKTIGIGIMALELLWALFLSPVFHYHLEKGITYRQKNQTLGYVGLDDRGIGSWRKYFRQNLKNTRDRRIIIGVNLLSVLVLTGTVMKEESVLEFFDQYLKIKPYIMLTTMCIIYAAAAIALLVFSLVVLNFPDTKDPERGKKRIYSMMFIGLVIGLNFAIVGIFHDFGLYIGVFFRYFGWEQLSGLLILTAVFVLIMFILTMLWFPIFLKMEDLYESIPDLLTIVLSGIVFLILWNYMSEIFMDLGSGLTHFSWRDDDPLLLRQEFHWGEFLSNVGTYHYWGWVQELLFLGYFCWLSWKAFPDNKWANATISSILFCLFHWPNLPLMLATAIGGFMWAIWWGERRNLFMMGIMHGFNGSLVDYLIPMSMSVGPGVL